MAPAVQSAIVDLTGDDDDNDDSIARTQAACEKAFAAASRLTNHFESMKTPKPIAYQSPNGNGGLTAKASPSATVSKPPMLPRLKTFPKAAGPDAYRLQNDVKNNAIPRQSSSISNPIISSPLPALRTTDSKPANSPSVSGRTKGEKEQPRESKSVTPRTDASIIRTPRSAAISAKQNITETYSELEEWVNKDPKIVPPHAGVNTPRKLGRPNDDLEEWSPSSNTNHKEDEREGMGGRITDSPKPSAGKHEDSTANGDNGLSRTQGVSASLGTRKRKFSGSSQPRTSPINEARSSKEPSTHQEPYPLSFAELAKRKYVPHGATPAERSPKAITAPLFECDLKASRLEHNSPGKATVKINDELPLKSSNADSSNNGAPTKPSMLHSQVRGDPRHQRGFHDASDPTTSEPGLYLAALVPIQYTVLFESVVYPAIRKAKKSYKDNLSFEKLDAIGKCISTEVLGRLPSHSKDPYQLDEDTRKKIKRFVKKLFRQSVRRANAQSSHDSATPANHSRLDPSGLGGTSRGNVILAGGHPPLTPDLDCSKNASSSRETAVLHSPDESQTPPFGPNFDRGRYPALRRRRGNKYYTPAKTSKSTLRFEKDQTLGNIGHVVSTPASYADVSKAQGRMTDIGETPSISPRPVSSHISEFQKGIAADHSAPQLPRNMLLKDPSPPKELRPIYCPKPATALDPSFEHVVAVLVSDTSSRPSCDGQRYTITPRNRIQLAADQSIVKHVDIESKVGKPKFVRIETKVIDPVRQPGRCISSLLRNRELGLSSRGRRVGTIHELHQLRSEMIEPWKNWKGASGDVVAVAWSPDSNVYAFGAAAHANIEDIQYNRPCNLLLGNLSSNQIRELPDHRIDRPKPESIPNGPNATQAVYDACDPKVYETVTSVAFSPAEDRMFTASHDCTVKIWDVSAGKHQCLSTLRHEAWVTSVEVSEHQQGVFATASKSVKDAIRIYYNSANALCHVNFSASRAEMKPEWKIYPECLRWGPNHYTSHLLLAGFQQWGQHGDSLSGGGQLCLWDANAFETIKVTPSSQSVFAAAWHPTQPFFATGGAPGNNVIDKVNTKTVVRIWDVRTTKRCHVEYECPATDMQDVTFSPLNPNIVTAGCTDGVSYVWDWRWPDQLLHRLEHGRPLAELDHTREREEADTGVMLSLWGPSGSLFYTGSSDGMIKAWDVRRHPQDVLISNVADLDVSIQSGAFSPDGNNLLVGDAEGGIHVLSSAPCGPRSNIPSTDAYIDLVRASNGSGLRLDQNDDNPGTEGIEAARTLVESDQLEYHSKFGVGQGPRYQGPYAKYARKEADESGFGRLRRRFEKKQPISKKGESRWDIAIPMTTLLVERKETLDREKRIDKMKLDGLDEASPFFSTPQRAIPIGHPSVSEGSGATIACGIEDLQEDNRISESEMIEENYWWSRLGEEEIDHARAGRTKH